VALFRESGVGFVAVLLTCRAGTGEIGLTRFDVQVEEVEDDALREIVEGAVVDDNALASVDYLDPVQVRLLHAFEMRYSGVNSGEIVPDGILVSPSLVIRRGDLDTTHILLYYARVAAVGFYKDGLNTMFGKFLGERPAAHGDGVDGVVDGHLAVVVLQKVVYILPALGQNLVPQQHRLGGGVQEEIVVRHVLSWAQRRTPIITQVEYMSFDA
jgi:hypothetical protein